MSRIKFNPVKLFIYLLCVLLLFTTLSVRAYGDESGTETVRAAWYEDSYHITGENGERSGYGYEYEQSVAAYASWDYEYVKGGWKELLGKLEKGEIDIMGSVSHTAERDKTMLFSELPMGEEKYFLYADLDNTDISASNLKTLNDKPIGMLEGSTQTIQFCQWEKNNNIKTRHVFVKGFTDAVEKMKKGEIAGVISAETPDWVNLGTSAIATIGGSDVYYVINKNRPDLKEKLDNAMREMEHDKPFYKEELYKRYLSSESIAVLSKDEKDWISNHGTIRVGYLKNDSGISFTDENTGELTGVINDYVEYATDCLSNQKLDFELMEFDNREAQLEALKKGEIDMIFHVSQNPYVAEENGYALSNTVWKFNLGAVTAKEHFDENDENTVAVAKENFALKSYISYNYPRWDVLEYETLDEATNAMKKGEADCFVINSTQVVKYIDNYKIHSVFLSEPGNTSFAIKKGNAVLLSILNKTLNTMSESMLTGALSKYDNVNNKVTLTDYIKDNLLQVTLALVSVFLIILLFVLILLKRTKDTARKTTELNKRLENANSAKTNFLFNMSHDIRTPMNALLGYNTLMKKELTDPKLLEYQTKIEQSGKILLSIINNVLDMARIESGKMELDENYARVGAVLEDLCGVFEAEAGKKGVTLTHDAQVTHNHIMCDETKIKEIFINLLSNAVKYTPEGGKVSIIARELPCDRKGYVCIQTEVTDNGIGMSKEYLPSLFDSFTRERNTTTGRVAGTGLGMPIVKKLVELMGGTIGVESKLGAGTRFRVVLNHRIADEVYYKEQSDSKSEIVRKEHIQGKRILLAEDNDLNAEIAMTILEDMGVKADRVEDGIKCVDAMEQMPAGTYDMILMDIQMPNMDGYKATMAIRRFSDEAKANIPIFAMTANAFEEDRKKALSKGMNGHIAKPIDVDKIEEAILSICNSQT